MTTDLALTRPDPTMNEDALRVMMAAAQRYVQSGLLPSEVNTPQKALVVMTAGREMGVPATYALRNIHVVKGKPVCSAELLLALVRRSYGPASIRVAKTSNTACTVQYREQGWDGISEYTFTIEDAKQAGVAGSNTWKAYPAAMLRARCISAVVRFAFPECIAGLYTPEEMGAEVTVNDAGEVQIVDGEVIEPASDDDGPERCDKATMLRRWHQIVKGTRFEQDDTRHKFVAWHTQDAFTSLGAFLDQATDEEAEALLVEIRKRVNAESVKLAKRAELIQEVETAVKHANTFMDEPDRLEIPANVNDLADDDIRSMIATANRVIESAAVTA